MVSYKIIKNLPLGSYLFYDNYRIFEFKVRKDYYVLSGTKCHYDEASLIVIWEEDFEGFLINNRDDKSLSLYKDTGKTRRFIGNSGVGNFSVRGDFRFGNLKFFGKFTEENIEKLKQFRKIFKV